jgi:hypothetical protein
VRCGGPGALGRHCRYDHHHRRHDHDLSLWMRKIMISSSPPLSSSSSSSPSSSWSSLLSRRWASGGGGAVCDAGAEAAAPQVQRLALCRARPGGHRGPPQGVQGQGKTGHTQTLVLIMSTPLLTPHSPRPLDVLTGGGFVPCPCYPSLSGGGAGLGRVGGGDERGGDSWQGAGVRHRGANAEAAGEGGGEIGGEGGGGGGEGGGTGVDTRDAIAARRPRMDRPLACSGRLLGLHMKVRMESGERPQTRGGLKGKKIVARMFAALRWCLCCGGPCSLQEMFLSEYWGSHPTQPAPGCHSLSRAYRPPASLPPPPRPLPPPRGPTGGAPHPA